VPSTAAWIFLHSMLWAEIETNAQSMPKDSRSHGSTIYAIPSLTILGNQPNSDGGRHEKRHVAANLAIETRIVDRITRSQ